MACKLCERVLLGVHALALGAVMVGARLLRPGGVDARAVALVADRWGQD